MNSLQSVQPLIIIFFFLTSPSVSILLRSSINVLWTMTRYLAFHQHVDVKIMTLFTYLGEL